MPTTQAARVFKKFGGVPNLQKALKAANPSKKWSIGAIYRWNLPRSSGGSGGIIPGQALTDVINAARREGFVLTPDDLYPTAEKR